MKRNILSILFIALIMPWANNTQALEKFGQTGFKFLDVGISARAEAMSGAFTMTGNDANAMFYNPAGLSRMESQLQVVTHRVQWIADIMLNVAGVAYNFENIGVFGASFGMVDYGELIGTVIAPTEQGYRETGNLDVGSYFVGLAYSRQLTDKFFIGGQIKYAHENLGQADLSAYENPEQIADNKLGAMAYDFGTMYCTGIKSLRLGMSIRNFSQEVKYIDTGFQLPLTFKIGAAMDILDAFYGAHEDHSLNIAFDASHPRDFSERINFGAEYWYKDMVALRGGYSFNHDVSNLSGGIGIEQDIGGVRILIDYSFTNNEYFDGVNRFSLGIAY